MTWIVLTSFVLRVLFVQGNNNADVNLTNDRLIAMERRLDELTEKTAQVRVLFFLITIKLLLT